MTEGLSQVLGSIYDGNPKSLEGLIESEDVNEYVRNAAIDTFLVLEQSGQMRRELVVDYFKQPHPTRFVEMTGIDRGKGGLFTRWIRPRQRLAA
jgi:hypothetical protein